jgi:hypothetical protein
MEMKIFSSSETSLAISGSARYKKRPPNQLQKHTLASLQF